MSDQPEERIKETGVFAHLLGVWYPTHYVVGVIEDPVEADRAGDALRAAWREAGAPEDAVQVFHAADAREGIRRTEGFYGPGKRALAAMSHGVGSEEGVADQDYQAAVSKGHSILTVLAPTPDAVERAHGVLARFGARHMRHYGPHVVTDLRG